MKDNIDSCNSAENQHMRAHQSDMETDNCRRQLSTFFARFIELLAILLCINVAFLSCAR